MFSFNILEKKIKDQFTITYSVLISGSNLRWTSRENLLTAANDEDPQLFVSLYDFQAGGENQLSLRKTEQVRILSYNKSGEWCEAHNAQGMCSNSFR